MKVSDIKLLYGLIPGPVLNKGCLGHVIKTLESLNAIIEAGYEENRPIKLIGDKIFRYAGPQGENVLDILRRPAIQEKFKKVFERFPSRLLADGGILNPNTDLLASAEISKQKKPAPLFFHEFSMETPEEVAKKKEYFDQLELLFSHENTKEPILVTTGLTTTYMLEEPASRAGSRRIPPWYEALFVTQNQAKLRHIEKEFTDVLAGMIASSSRLKMIFNKFSVFLGENPESIAFSLIISELNLPVIPEDLANKTIDFIDKRINYLNTARFIHSKPTQPLRDDGRLPHIDQLTDDEQREIRQTLVPFFNDNLEFPTMYFLEDNGAYGHPSKFVTYQGNAHLTTIELPRICPMGVPEKYKTPFDLDTYDRIVMANPTVYRDSYIGMLFLMLKNFDQEIKLYDVPDDLKEQIINLIRLLKTHEDAHLRQLAHKAEQKIDFMASGSRLQGAIRDKDLFICEGIGVLQDALFAGALPIQLTSAQQIESIPGMIKTFDRLKETAVSENQDVVIAAKQAVSALRGLAIRLTDIIALTEREPNPHSFLPNIKHTTEIQEENLDNFYKMLEVSIEELGLDKIYAGISLFAQTLTELRPGTTKMDLIVNQVSQELSLAMGIDVAPHNLSKMV